MKSLHAQARFCLLFLLSFALVGPRETQAQVLVEPPDARAPTVVGRTYGTQDVTYHTVGAWAFTGFNAGDSALFAANGSGQRYCAGAPCSFTASVHLPAGAKVVKIGVFQCDTHSTAEVSLILFRFPIQGGPAVPLASVSSDVFGGGTVGCLGIADILVDPETIDNFRNSYLLQVVITGTDDRTRFSAVRIEYGLQVSPAPATAKFNDVPTNHIFFQFIEALAAAGITGGCSTTPPLYCPDDPVTRGQMAVFIGRALGLHFPQ